MLKKGLQVNRSETGFLSKDKKNPAPAVAFRERFRNYFSHTAADKLIWRA